MKKAIKTMLAILGFSFLVSFVASLIGIAFAAIIFGNYCKEATATLKKSNFFKITILFIVIEIGFLLSAWLHKNIFSNLADIYYLVIGFAIGAIFFVLGIILRKYDKAKNRSRLEKRKISYREVIKMPI